MRSHRIRHRSPTDEEPTLEAPPEEPTLSGETAPELTIPGTPAVLVDAAPWEDAAEARDCTLPMATVVTARAPLLAPPAPSSAPSTPTFVPSAPSSASIVNPGEEVGLPPGIEEQRRTLRRVAIGIVTACVLLCAAAFGVGVLRAKEEPRPSKTTIATAASPATPPTSASGDPAPRPIEEPRQATATASAPPPTPDSASAIVAEAPAPLPAPPPTSKVASKPEPVVARVDPPRPAPIPRHAAPPPPAKPPQHTDIVRDAPF